MFVADNQRQNRLFRWLPSPLCVGADPRAQADRSPHSGEAPAVAPFPTKYAVKTAKLILVLHIDAALDWQQLDAGKVLYRKGDKSRDFFIVISESRAKYIAHSRWPSSFLGREREQCRGRTGVRTGGLHWRTRRHHCGPSPRHSPRYSRQ